MTSVTHTSHDEKRSLRQAFVDAVANNRGLFIFLGLVQILIGTAAIVFPIASSVAVELVAGMSLFFAGCLQIFQAFRLRTWGNFFLFVLVGTIWALAGLILLARPAEGLIALTAFIAIAFVAEGLVRSVAAFQIKPASGWGWVLASGLAAIVIGLLIAARLPISAAWMLGFLTGMNILIAGIAMLMVAMVADKAETAASE